MHITIQLEDGEIMLPHNEIILQKERVVTRADLRNSRTFSMGSSLGTAMSLSSSIYNQLSSSESSDSSGSSEDSSSSSEDEEATSTDEDDARIARDERGRFVSMGTRRVPDMPNPPPPPSSPSRLDVLTQRIRRNMLASSDEDNPPDETRELRERVVEDMDEAADLLIEDVEDVEDRVEAEPELTPTNDAQRMIDEFSRSVDERQRERLERLEREMFDRNEIVHTNHPAGEIPLGPPVPLVSSMSEAALLNYERMLGMPSTPTVPSAPTWQYYMRYTKSSLRISKEEYERVQGLLRQLNREELRGIEDGIKIQAVKDAWKGKNQALFGIDLG